MTDAEFLDNLQRRAAASIAPVITNQEWIGLEAICGRTVKLVVQPCGKDTWAAAPDSLYGAVRLARREMAEAVTRRLKA